MREVQGFFIFESQGRGMLLDSGNIRFAKFLMHFQPFKGLKFPGGAGPPPSGFRMLPAFTSILSHSIKHVSLTPWFTTCTFSTVNSRLIFPNLDRILRERVATLVRSFKNIWSKYATAFSFRIEIDRGVLLGKNTNVIFVQRVAGTTFEDSFMTWTK